ncbi:hypothetical protein Tco_0122512 [Tanacetum coccineum]
MELENSQNKSLAKLPILKLGEYLMWEIRIKQYFQIQDYALWEVIENGNSWVPIPVTAPESGPSTVLKMTVPSTTEEKICKKKDVKAKSLLLMALPNEHQLTFNQYADAQSMFIAIKARFGGNDATKKTQKALLLQKLVSRLAILGVETSPEDLNVKFLRSLPSEWDTHVVVWMNKPDFETMGLDDLYNNFKIVEQKVKRTVAVEDKNLAFLTTTSSSSTNPINTVNTGVSTGTIKVNTAGTETSTASFSDATVYAFLSTQPQGSQLVHEDLEQIHDDDLEEMDLKWNMALLSMRARKFYQRTGRKIVIDGSSTAGYDKSKDSEPEVTDKSKRGFGYTAVPSPHPLILNRPTPLDLSYSGLEEFQHPEINGYSPKDSSLKQTNVCERESNNSKENTDDSLTQQPRTGTRSAVIPLQVDKEWKEKLFHPANNVSTARHMSVNMCTQLSDLSNNFDGGICYLLWSTNGGRNLLVKVCKKVLSPTYPLTKLKIVFSCNLEALQDDLLMITKLITSQSQVKTPSPLVNTVSSTPHTRFTKDHPKEWIKKDSPVLSIHAFLACFLSQEEPKIVSKALSDPAWVGRQLQENSYRSKLQK